MFVFCVALAVISYFSRLCSWAAILVIGPLIFGFLYALFDMFVKFDAIPHKWRKLYDYTLIASLTYLAIGYGYHWFANMVNDCPSLVNLSQTNHELYLHDEIYSHFIIIGSGGAVLLLLLIGIIKYPKQIELSLSDIFLFGLIELGGGAVVAWMAIGVGTPPTSYHLAFLIGGFVNLALVILLHIRTKNDIFWYIDILIVSFDIVYPILLIPYYI